MAIRANGHDRCLVFPASRDPPCPTDTTGGLVPEVLEEHVREYPSPVGSDVGPLKADAVEELIEIIYSYLT